MDNLNKYYNIINELIDEYIIKWKIKPSRLKKYLKKGTKRFENFKLRNDLIDVKYIDKIIEDVIDDRSSMEVDNVLTFESFSGNIESENKLSDILFNGLEKSDIEMEKVLADRFDTNLSSITSIDSNKHIFSVEGWGNDSHQVIIYHDEDLDIITDNLIEYITNILSKTKLEPIKNISLELYKLIDREEIYSYIENKVLVNDFLLKLIASETGYEFDSKLNEYFIWIME